MSKNSVDPDFDVVVVGDGPTGLSAALFLAKNDLDVAVFGENETYLHDAYLYNYLGIDAIDGSQFVDVAREQVERFGGELHTTMVTKIKEQDGLYAAHTSGSRNFSAPYLVLAEGDGRGLSEQLGLEFEEWDGGDEVVATDKNGRTSKEDVYAGGWTARNNKIQAAISVGDGAAIALDILSKENGRQFHDFDVPE